MAVITHSEGSFDAATITSYSVRPTPLALVAKGLGVLCVVAGGVLLVTAVMSIIIGLQMGVIAEQVAKATRQGIWPTIAAWGGFAFVLIFMFGAAGYLLLRGTALLRAAGRHHSPIFDGIVCSVMLLAFPFIANEAMTGSQIIADAQQANNWAFASVLLWIVSVAFPYGDRTVIRVQTTTGNKITLHPKTAMELAELRLELNKAIRARGSAPQEAVA